MKRKIYASFLLLKNIFIVTRACRLSLEKWWSSCIKCASHPITHNRSFAIRSKDKLWKIWHTIEDELNVAIVYVYIIKFITVGRERGDYHHHCDAVRICKCSFLSLPLPHLTNMPMIFVYQSKPNSKSSLLSERSWVIEVPFSSRHLHNELEKIFSSVERVFLCKLIQEKGFKFL